MNKMREFIKKNKLQKTENQQEILDIETIEELQEIIKELPDGVMLEITYEKGKK